MRGKEAPAAHHHRTAGITPACAGKSIGETLLETIDRDHPRVCGEKQQMIADAGKGMGSPPRMRGKAERRSKRPQNPGITPAYAGKRLGLATRTSRERDHPRVCGEKACMQCTLQGHGGSPPRMRGKEHVRLRQQHSPRITPAYAEKRAAQAGRAVGHGQNYDGSSPASRSK